MDAVAQETIDYIALTRLQSAYADVVTRRAWPELGELFLPRASVVIDTRNAPPFELTGPEAVGTFISEAIAGFEFFEFVIFNRRIFLGTDGDDLAATGRLYFGELRQDRASGRWSTAYGVYHDRYEKSAGRWWFSGRRHHSLARTAPDCDVFPFPGGDLFAP
jgi:hypothetical protein